MSPVKRFLEICMLIAIAVYLVNLAPIAGSQAQEMFFCIPSPGKIG